MLFFLSFIFFLLNDIVLVYNGYKVEVIYVNIYTSLDIGNDSIKVLVLEAIDDSYHVLATTTYPSIGMKKNKIQDEKRLRESIRNALIKTEEKLGMKIKEVILCVPTGSANMTIESGFVPLKEHMVRGIDISKVLEDASRDCYENDRELVSCLPISFTVDENASVLDPKGETGEKLFTKAVVSTSLKDELYPFIELVQSVGINIVDIIYNAQADYYTASTKELDRKMGAIINIGGDVTTVSIFNKGIMIKNTYLPLGSSTVDKDISYVYKVDLQTAKKLKETFALSCHRYADSNDKERIVDVNGKSFEVNQIQVSEIVEARIRELLKLAKNEINRLTKRQISYIIVVGGISELAGFNYIVEEVLGNTASCYNMQEVGARHNKFTSAFGAILYFHRKCCLTEEKRSMFSSDMINTFLSPKKRSTVNETGINKFFHHFFDN